MILPSQPPESHWEALERERAANMPCDAVERDRQCVEVQIDRLRWDAYWDDLLEKIRIDNAAEDAVGFP